MGDSACLMHSFSFTSGLTNGSNQGNPMHALGESISFGRFMSESLSWEKWSTFSQNRYVEEAERYSRPGSVAQKKAFFEAHYRRAAAKKAASLLEQASNTAEQDRESSEVSSYGAASDVQKIALSSKVIDEEADHVAVSTDKDSSVPAQAELVEEKAEWHLQNETTEPSGIQQSEDSIRRQDDFPSVTSEKKTAPDAIKPSDHFNAPRIPIPPPMPNVQIHPKLENTEIPVTEKNMFVSMPDKISHPKSLNMLINLASDKESDNVPDSGIPDKERTKGNKNGSLRDVLATPSLEDGRTETPVTTSSNISESRLEKRSHPKSLNMLINLAVDKEPYAVPDPGMLAKEKNMGKENGSLKNVLAMPSLGNGRTETPVTAYQSKTGSPKLHILTSVLRIEERDAKQKQKLEENFDAKEVRKEKAKLPTRLRKKAGKGFRKLTQSLCFKAHPLPDLYGERDIPKNQTEKTSATHAQSRKLGGKPALRKAEGTISLAPPTIALANYEAYKNPAKGNGHKLSNLLSSQPELVAYENKSPNIQP